MNLIEVKGLTKKFKEFELSSVDITLEEGYIMGFIGRNGAGKTTTIKSMLNLMAPDSGKIKINGYDIKENELEVKRTTGFVSGGVDFFPNERLKKITAVTKLFYKDWDQEYFEYLCKRFEIDVKKKVKELSAGMKVKYSLAVAMASRPTLLLLDEPTSGLDPAARDDLILMFQEFIEDGKHSILFSTHITSDLEKCADYITYIKNGKIIDSTDKESFKEKFILVNGKTDDLTEELKSKLIGFHQHNFGFEGLLKAEDKALAEKCETAKPSLEDIMIHLERREA